MISFCDKDGGGFVVCDGGLCLRLIPPDDPVAVGMDSGFVEWGIILFKAENTMETVDDLNIFVTVILIIPIDKPVIPAGYGIVSDAITGQYIYLHPVIGYKQVASPAADAVGGIVKQIVDIEGQEIIRCEIIEKKVLFQVDGCLDVHAVITKIHKGNPFGKRGECTAAAIGFQRQCAVLKEPAGKPIGGGGILFPVEAAKTDMFILISDGTAVIQRSVFFFGMVNSWQHSSVSPSRRRLTVYCTTGRNRNAIRLCCFAMDVFFVKYFVTFM